MAFYSLGIYIRLSQADFDLAKKEGKTESESISHQRDLILRYIQSIMVPAIQTTSSKTIVNMV